MASFIDEQLALEAESREVLPYKFDKCSHELGSLRQEVYACLTCSPPPASAAQQYTPAGICYACSISCHGDHNLVELFNRRNFVCDCGTDRFTNEAPCTLRSDPITGARGVHSQESAKTNTYNQNFQNKFCICGEEYDADKEKGTMYQCIGLGKVETGGCGEDWFHPECLMGIPKDWHSKAETKDSSAVTDGEAKESEHPTPPGFPNEDDFEGLICYKCVEAYPWIKAYAGTEGFLPALFRDPARRQTQAEPPSSDLPRPNLKRKASDDLEENPQRPSSPSKRVKEEPAPTTTTTDIATSEPTQPLEAQPTQPIPSHKHTRLPGNPPTAQLSLLLRPDFRDHLCHCPTCYPNLLPHPILLEEESAYEPSLSSSSPSQPNGHTSNRSAGSASARSLLDRGEAALNNIDRVRAIEGVMVYNHLKDKVKAFLKPYADEGRVVSAEDIKQYFEGLRGDTQGIKEAGEKAEDAGAESGGDGRREQRGY